MNAPWQKLGLVFAPSGQWPMCSHAILPTPLLLDDRIRVFFASCDEARRGRIFFVDLDPAWPQRLLAIERRPVLDLGAAGSFDVDGVNPCHIVVRGEELWLYYVGWQRRTDVPYTLFAGLAVSRDNGRTFTRMLEGPILPPCPGERYFRTAPYVSPTNGEWMMFYIGGNEFFVGHNGKTLPRYSLRRITSKDGITWPTAGEEVLKPRTDRGEIGFGRPFLWHDAKGHASVLISVRSEAGYKLHEVALSAEKLLGRLEPVIFEGASEPWDDEMTCFGAACRFGDREFLFYNGNQFGRGGFGVATRTAAPEN
jgi:hypothetical protein